MELNPNILCRLFVFVFLFVCLFVCLFFVFGWLVFVVLLPELSL